MSDHNLAEALRTGLEAALELLEMKGQALGHDSPRIQTYKDAVAELREALAAHEAEQQAGEAVAWVDERAIAWLDGRSRTATITTKLQAGKSLERPMPLFTHPQQPLTEEQLRLALTGSPTGHITDTVRGIAMDVQNALLGITQDTK